MLSQSFVVHVAGKGRRRCELHKSEGAGSGVEVRICTSVLGMDGRMVLCVVLSSRRGSVKLGGDNYPGRAGKVMTSVKNSLSLWADVGE